MLAQARVHVAFVLTNQNLVLVRPLCKLETSAMVPLMAQLVMILRALLQLVQTVR
jgi:hypothetical protein